VLVNKKLSAWFKRLPAPFMDSAKLEMTGFCFPGYFYLLTAAYHLNTTHL
jgi:hypothetical protein